MPRTAVMADGTELEFPDEATDEAMQRGVKAYMAKQGGAQSPAAPPRSTVAPDAPMGFGGPVVPVATDLLTGAAKGGARTVLGLGKQVASAGGLGTLTPEQEAAFNPETWGLQAQSTPEAIGGGAEQMAEFALIPGPGKVRGAAKALELAKGGLASAGLARAQGASPTEAVVAGGLTAIPVAEGLETVGAWAREHALPLVRAAIKPTVTSMSRVAGAAREGLNAKAEVLVKFILENRVTTADKARAIFQEAERDLQRVLSLRNAPTDEPGRAVRYLEALEKSAAKQRLPAEDVGKIRNAAAELLEGSLGETKVRMVTRPHASLVDPQGNPIMVLVPENYREMRTSTPAAEAMRAARSSSRWSTNKSWGEQKGTDKETRKAIERAGRDAVKAAVPEARPLLAQESKAIQATKVLDRMEFRTANRDAVSLPAHVIAAGEIASGRVPVLAMAANWLRNNQLKAGIYADQLATAIERGDAPAAARILQKLGVGAGVAAAQ